MRLRIFLGLLFVLIAGPSAAHEVRPAYLELIALDRVPLSEETDRVLSSDGTSGARYAMTWKVPIRNAGVLAIEPVLPAACRDIDLPRIEDVAGARLHRVTLDCGPDGLRGRELAIDGLRTTLVDVLVRLELSDGTSHSHLLRPDAPSVVLGGEGNGEASLPVSGYLRLGVEHILLGIDHLLFVLALLFIVRGRWLLLKAITAFTVAHSITLALATLGVVRFPSASIEAVIALSIVFLASELLRLARGEGESLTVRQPWIAAFAFGLLHGFGFAGALSEIGLPEGEIPAALFLFNVGVELGQLAFVAAASLLYFAIKHLVAAPPAWARPLPAYGIGSVAAFWVIERVGAFF